MPPPKKKESARVLGIARLLARFWSVIWQNSVSDTCNKFRDRKEDTTNKTWGSPSLIIPKKTGFPGFGRLLCAKLSFSEWPALLVCGFFFLKASCHNQTKES